MKKFKLYKKMVLEFWFLALSTPTSWALNGCFALNIFRMDPSSVSRLALLLKVTPRYLVSTTLTLSVQLSKLLLSVLCFLLLSQINGLFGNLMSRMLSSMALITTQKVHFYKLKLNCTKHFWIVVRPLYLIWHDKNLENVTNQFLVSFSVFGSFFITKIGQDWWRVLCKLWQGKLKINQMKNSSFGALQKPLPNLARGYQNYQ